MTSKAGADGGCAPTAVMEQKINRLLGAEKLNAVVYEKLEYTTTTEGSDGTQESSTGTVIMHGLIKWGERTRGLPLQREHLGLEPPLPRLEACSKEFVKNMRGVRVDSDCFGISDEMVSATVDYLASFRARYGEGATIHGPWPEFGAGAKKEAGVEDIGGDQSDPEGDEGEATEKRDLSDMKAEERAMVVKERVDAGWDLDDFRGEMYYDYMQRKGFIAQEIQDRETKKRKANTESMAYGGLMAWQRALVDRVTLTEPHDRKVIWYLDEEGGKVCAPSSPAMCHGPPRPCHAPAQGLIFSGILGILIFLHTCGCHSRCYPGKCPGAPANDHTPRNMKAPPQQGHSRWGV